jgi:hypothetical protein
MLNQNNDFASWNDDFVDAAGCFNDMDRRGFGRYLLPLAPHAGPSLPVPH